MVDFRTGRPWKGPGLEEMTAKPSISKRAVLAATGALAGVVLLGIGAQRLYRSVDGWLELRGMREQVGAYAAAHDGAPGVSRCDLEDLARRAGVRYDGAFESGCARSPAECLSLTPGEMGHALGSYRLERYQNQPYPDPDALTRSFQGLF